MGFVWPHISTLETRYYWPHSDSDAEKDKTENGTIHQWRYSALSRPFLNIVANDNRRTRKSGNANATWNLPMNSNNPRCLMPRVLQQNTWKSQKVWLYLLNDVNTDDIDLILIQEPCINHLHLTSATPHWSVLYLSQHLSNPKETVLLISTRISSNATQKIEVDSLDMIAVTVKTAHLASAFCSVCCAINEPHNLWEQLRPNSAMTGWEGDILSPYVW